MGTEEGSAVQDSSVFWNSWAERDGREVTYLEPGRHYKVFLDIARFRYRDGRSVPIAPELDKTINEAATRGETHLRLVVRPLLLGTSLARGDRFEPEILLRLPLDRLTPPTKAQRADFLAQLRLAKIEKRPLSAATKDIFAGRIEVPIRTTSTTGCAQVALTIWDETGIRPLDHVVQTVSVRSAGQKAPPCETLGLQSGFRSLDAFFPSGEDAGVDASLHFFEFNRSEGPLTVGMYVDARRHTPGAPVGLPGDTSVHAWTLMTPLTTSIGNPDQLLASIRAARKDGSYAGVADELRCYLFSAENETEQREADAALSSMAAISEKAKAAGMTPVVMVRAVTHRNRPVYVPLGLLAAEKDERIIPAPITVVQPLPRTRFVAGDTCVDSWKLGIPETLDGYTPAIVIQTPPGMERFKSLDALERFLKSNTATPGRPGGPGTSEALLILAHQGEGYLWFTGGGGPERILPEEIRHRFPPGSLAVLSACSAASPAGDNQRVLEILNARGVDAIVASPFPIEAPFGVAFAKAFVEVVHAARESGATPTILELYKSALERAPELIDEASRGRMKEKALEFIIAGDFGIRLCGK